MADDTASVPAHPTPESSTPPQATKPKARDLNDVLRYTMWSVFKVDRAALAALPADAVTEVDEALASLRESDDVVGRGWYDVAGSRADADLMLWSHAETSTALQTAYHAVLSTSVGRAFVPVWSQMALHRPAEFNKSHVPAFLADERAREFVSVYPFVRSFEWYLLPDEERRELLMEHGIMGREYPDVRANTVPAFSLGDYEWILAFEADDLSRIVDLMRHLRASRARLHVREEIPFYTGRRRELSSFLADVR